MSISNWDLEPSVNPIKPIDLDNISHWRTYRYIRALMIHESKQTFWKKFGRQVLTCLAVPALAYIYPIWLVCVNWQNPPELMLYHNIIFLAGFMIFFIVPLIVLVCVRTNSFVRVKRRQELCYRVQFPVGTRYLFSLVLGNIHMMTLSTFLATSLLSWITGTIYLTIIILTVVALWYLALGTVSEHSVQEDEA